MKIVKRKSIRAQKSDVNARFVYGFIDWTCAGEECGATAEITRSLQIDLVLNDMAATSEP